MLYKATIRILFLSFFSFPFHLYIVTQLPVTSLCVHRWSSILKLMCDICVCLRGCLPTGQPISSHSVNCSVDSLNTTLVILGKFFVICRYSDELCVHFLALVWSQLLLANRNCDFSKNCGRLKSQYFFCWDYFFSMILTLLASSV